MTALNIIKTISKACGGLSSTEGRSVNASNSEFVRWFAKKSIIINGIKVSEKDEINETELLEIILHPSGRSRTSFLFND